MNIRESYNAWSSQYDTNENKTRDLEALALRKVLDGIRFENCLEVGCGTGKNSAWLLSRCGHISAVDFSEKMLQIAREKVKSPNVRFIEGDITKATEFIDGTYDLIVFSLVLEHIEDLEAVFLQLTDSVVAGGKMYIGELHPYRQYGGSKARFGSGSGTQEVTCFSHHISDFIRAGKNAGFVLEDVDEHFDEDNRRSVPRIISVLFRKPHPG